MKSVIAAIAAIAASVVSAQTIVSSQPSTSQVLTAGTTSKIVWSPVSGTISTIDLRKGAASALTFVSNVATNVDASTGSYTWSIDASLAAGTDYALSFGQSPNVSYTPFFTIQAASGAAASGSASSVASTTAAAASSVVGTTTKAAATSAAATTKAAASSSAAASAAASSTSTSGANKNVAAVGVAAVAGAVVAALI